MLILDDVVLRRLEVADLDRLYEYRNDREVMVQLGGFSVGYSRAALVDWLEKHRRRDDEVLWCIAARPDDRCIGHVGLYRIDSRVRKAEFAILVGDRSLQGRGIGKVVTRTVIDYGFRELNLHRVSLQVLETNERAIRLYESLGFAREGTLRHEQFRDGRYVDVLLMSFLEDDWRATLHA